jgi:hypothetical protein
MRKPPARLVALAIMFAATGANADPVNILSDTYFGGSLSNFQPTALTQWRRVLTNIRDAICCQAVANNYLTTSGATPGGSSTLNFASVPSTVSVGARIFDSTKPNVILGGTYVVATTSTTVTMSGQAQLTGVGSGDKIAIMTPRGLVVTIGDSQFNGTGAGTGSSGLDGAYPISTIADFATFLAPKVPTSFNTLFGDQNIPSGENYATYDPRVTLNSWAPSVVPSLGGNMFSATSSNLIFAPTQKFDTVKIVYPIAAGLGAFTIQVDGTSLTDCNNVSEAGGSNLAIAVCNVSGANVADIVHTVTVVPSVATTYIAGIITSDSTVPAVDIIQAGQSGEGVVRIATVVNGYDPLNSLATLAPDLTLIELAGADVVGTAQNIVLPSAMVSAGSSTITFSSLPSTVEVGAWVEDLGNFAALSSPTQVTQIAGNVVTLSSPTLLSIPMSDSIGFSTKLSTYQANLNNIVNVALCGSTSSCVGVARKGDVVMVLGPPLNDPNFTSGVYLQYDAIVYGIAAANNLPVVDLRRRLISFANANAIFPYFDGRHPGRHTQQDDALALINSIDLGAVQPQRATEHVTFQPGFTTSVTGTKSGFHKFSNATSVDNLEVSATNFTCTVDVVLTMYECGTSGSCASPTTIGSATLNHTTYSAGSVVDGTMSNGNIKAGDYVAFAISAGTCTSLDIQATAQVHQN